MNENTEKCFVVIADNTKFFVSRNLYIIRCVIPKKQKNTQNQKSKNVGCGKKMEECIVWTEGSMFVLYRVGGLKCGVIEI
jgi:hypothetical protein